MKWLTLEYIKMHSRIDYNDEDELLELYGESAEDMIENVTGKKYAEILEEYGEFPKPLYYASLMLVECSYTQRSPVTMTNMAIVPYTFDFLVKPYMKLVP